MTYREPMTALQLFRHGHDTASIASILKVFEQEALQQVSSQRSALLGLCDPYQRQEPRPASRIPYAGHYRMSPSGV